MESTKIPFDYSNFSRDILFEDIQPSAKDKKKRDFIDCCKCLVWEENRTRYEKDESFRKKINFFKENCYRRSNSFINEVLKESDVISRGEVDFFHYNYPYNIPNFPQYPYLRYTYSTRCRWKYDPTEGRKQYCKKLLFEGLIGDKDHKIYKTKKVHLLKDESHPRASVLRLDETCGKVITRTVPITINIDPLVDPSVSKKIINDNFEDLMEIARAQKSLMQSEGYQFLTKKQIEEMRRLQKDYVEFNNGIYSAFDPLLKPKTILAYMSALQFLGLYRLLECQGLKWSQVEKVYDDHNQQLNTVPMTLKHYKYKVRKVLSLFPHKEIFN